MLQTQLMMGLQSNLNKICIFACTVTRSSEVNIENWAIDLDISRVCIKQYKPGVL
jgi:hypothetical protein